MPTVKAMNRDSDADASPLEVSSSESGGVCSTPETDVSVLDSPSSRQSSQKDRIWAADKVAQLTQEEKVRFPPYFLDTHRPNYMAQISLLTAADFWRTKSIIEKGIPAAKTSDGPNGARGGIFVGGTKVSG